MTRVGIYARISVEHGAHRADSIESQILLARAWIREQQKCGNALEEYCCYTDRGYSGTGFGRPAFQEMLRDARAGRIQCIVCKDASRLGRDYLQTGEYMEQIFPLLGVRLVCISEGYDSGRDMPGSLSASLRNLMNEWYARDIGRRVRLVKEQKKRQGEYLGSRAPYGYRISREDGKRVLAEDPEAIRIVWNMLCWQREGMKPAEIRKKLQEQGVNPPAEYQKTGRIYSEEPPAKKWDSSTIRHVLLSYTRGDYHTA